MTSNNSSKKKKFDLLLECALCNGDIINNPSKSLPCLHTFCTSCLTRITRGPVQRSLQDATTATCPVCREMVSTKNLKLDVIMEKLLYVRRLQQSRRFCEKCDMVDVASTHWCQDCQKFLCDTCLSQHEFYKPADKVIDVSKDEDFEKVSNFILPAECPRHRENYEKYCSRCKICLCLSCHSQHVSHKSMIVPIEKAAKDIKSQGEGLLAETSLRLTEEDQQIESMKQKIEKLETECAGKRGDIWNHIEKTHERLKNNARNFIEKMEAEKDKEIDELKKMIQIRQDLITQIEIINKNYHQLLQNFDNTDILHNYSRLEYKIKNSMRKPKNHYRSVFMNIEYDKWYLEFHAMCESKPLGQCWIGASSLEKRSVARSVSLPPQSAAYDNCVGLPYQLK